MPRRNPKKLRASFDPPASRLVEQDDLNPTHRSNGARGESRGRVKGRTWDQMSQAERAATSAALRRKT